jgi:hypothetical protein
LGHQLSGNKDITGPVYAIDSTAGTKDQTALRKRGGACYIRSLFRIAGGIGIANIIARYLNSGLVRVYTTGTGLKCGDQVAHDCPRFFIEYLL